MIDPNLPLELDDGTPVTLFKIPCSIGRIWVRTPDGCSVSWKNLPRPSIICWYNAKTGVFGNGLECMYKLLRNAEETGLYERDLEQ